VIVDAPAGNREARFHGYEDLGGETVSDSTPTVGDGDSPDQGRPVELARPGSEGGNVFEGSRGMHLDPRQVPMTLMEPAMEAGQPVTPSAPGAETSTPEGQSEAS
jgi:hypothetical protein